MTTDMGKYVGDWKNDMVPTHLLPSLCSLPTDPALFFFLYYPPLASWPGCLYHTGGHQIRGNLEL